ncbi:Cytochrome c peroxidase [Saitozyma sp. JCM 24511]|nr:Cytochrome c peroxidase [Saitozyma sp. JCM 24511]
MPVQTVKEGDYDGIREEIKKVMKQPGYDDGSAGPVFVRLAWHASGNFSLVESVDPANAGLHHAIAFLIPIQSANPWISHADLWTLAGVTAIETMGGPRIPWQPGRTDYTGAAAAEEHRGQVGDRLPDGAKGADHIRDVFGRMGFSDQASSPPTDPFQEIVALSGAHALGRCHADRSGFDGPWVVNPTRFSNQLMMLPSDMALIEDAKLRPWVEKYAADQDLFFKDFSLAFAKLIELGVDRDDTGFARLVKKAAQEGKPLDKVRVGGGGCPFAGAGSKGREAKL